MCILNPLDIYRIIRMNSFHDIFQYYTKERKTSGIKLNEYTIPFVRHFEELGELPLAKDIKDAMTQHKMLVAMDAAESIPGFMWSDAVRYLVYKAKFPKNFIDHYYRVLGAFELWPFKKQGLITLEKSTIDFFIRNGIIEESDNIYPHISDQSLIQFYADEVFISYKDIKSNDYLYA